MSKQSLNLGASANDNTGDTLRIGGDKINDNFNEIYTALGNGVNLTVSLLNPSPGQVLRYNGSSFVPSNYSNLTSALDVNGNSIISSSNGNINVATNGTGNLTVGVAGIVSTFSGTTGTIDFPTRVQYKNEFASLASAPAAADYPGFFFTVDGDDKPYVNINIATGGVGDTRAEVLTEYASINTLADVDVTTAAPTLNQVLKWNGSNWVPGDDVAGVSSINVWESIVSDSGTATADSQTDSLSILGGTNITTSIVDDALTIDFTGSLTTTLAALTDTDVSGITQGDSLFWDGTNWSVTRSPRIWWELNAIGVEHYTFAGPGFTGTVNDPTLYVYRGFTYVFDNSVQGGGHPFRIQSTQGLTGTPYTDGQSGSGSNILYWTVPLDAPSTLYYICTLHAAMAGTINVVG